MVIESIKMSWQNIVSSKLRSFLTILGVLIGVASVISLITIVQGITNEVTSQFSELGANTLTVQINGTPFKEGLSSQDIAGLEQLGGIEGVSPTLSITGIVSNKEISEEDALIEGKNAVYFQQNPDVIQSGRPLNILDMQNQSRACLIDETTAKRLFYSQNPLGQTLQINGNTFTVAGILSEDGDNSVLRANNNSDTGKVIIPYNTAMRLSGTGTIKAVDIFLKDTGSTDLQETSIRQYLDNLFRNEEDSYKLVNMEQLLATMDSMTGMLTAALVGIASISLLVGGIGIMNMMLVSVKERTSEIGLRKALGADPSRIQLQFLLESSFLSLIGGILGVVTGVGLSAVVCPLLDVGFRISFGAILLGISFSSLVGILFGWFPARSASHLNPIDALRSQ